jgi:hypothetical protein
MDMLLYDFLLVKLKKFLFIVLLQWVSFPILFGQQKNYIKQDNLDGLEEDPQLEV